MNVQKVVSRVLKDPNFAKELQAQAQRAAEGGVGSPDWGKFMSLFAENPQELTALEKVGSIPPGGGSGAVELGWRTTLTFTTLTTLACTCTTTTTTTTW